ncbi:iron-sulfur cluster carrier protein MrpORP [Candidatus Eisenbacteria bacterium]|uniref:Iron-sulfur cluster carrier protein n=1 Tax=Eiseniibacteriota bacterium TaxID=2212470 RepID=A0ABV6YQB0_UNCEI
MTSVNGEKACGAGGAGAGEKTGAMGAAGAGGDARKQAGQERKARIAERMAKVKHKLIVMSGKGGVGKSTVAAYLAIELAAQGMKVGLMDADIHGPSIPKMLGLDGERPVAAGPSGALPIEYSENLKVISIGFLLSSSDQAVIWRGPLKMGLIEQFLGDVEWGPLDYLIVDSPPGTGDEPLSVCQLLPDLDGAIVVSTPQDIAIADVEKSITFCRRVNTPVLGVIENMSGLICPHCGGNIDVFKSGGAERLARKMSVPFLGRIPVTPEVVEACDRGDCSLANRTSGPLKEAMSRISASIMKLGRSSSGTNTPQAGASSHPDDPGQARARMPASGDIQPEAGNQRIASPLDGDRLSAHFGHATKFAIYEVSDGKILGEIAGVPPPHAPGVIPAWLAEQGVTLVIAGGLGRGAMEAFAEAGIDVISGAPSENARAVVDSYLAGNLRIGENICDH